MKKYTPEDFKYLEGREFEHGKVDCYSMLQDVFKDFQDITLRNYARPDDWWITGEDLYVNNFKNENFYTLDEDLPLNELRVFDVFLVALPDNRSQHGKTPANHCAIYIGDGKVIHHRLGKRSQIKTYGGMLKTFTTHIIRHKEIKHSKLPVTKINLMDRILPHKKAILEEALKNGRSE